MKQAFGLSLVLIGVIAAILYLRREAPPPAAADAGAPPPDAGSEPAPGKVRNVALTRLVPTYALFLPAREAAPVRDQFLRLLAARGGRRPEALPQDPRAAFRVEVSAGAFKPLLGDLKNAKLEVRVAARPARPTTSGPGAIQIEVSVPQK
jgi:hypothetical protein